MTKTSLTREEAKMLAAHSSNKEIRLNAEALLLGAEKGRIEFSKKRKKD